MFEDLPKNAEDLLYCKNIIEDETGKTYIFENGKVLHLDKDTKICSEIIDRKVKIEKNGKYGAVVFFNDEMIKDLDNIELFNDLYFSKQQIKEKGYLIIEPVYNEMNIGKGYINSMDHDNLYIFDGYGKMIVNEQKESDFFKINEDTIYNGYRLYRGISCEKARIAFSLSKNKIYVGYRKKEESDNSSEDEYNFGNRILVYSKEGKLEEERSIDFDDIEPTYEDDIILITQIVHFGNAVKKYFNVKTNKEYNVSNYKVITAFKDGNAFLSYDYNSSKVHVLNKNFELSSKNYMIDLLDLKRNWIFLYNVESDYVPILLTKKDFWVGYTKRKYGYAYLNGRIMIPCKYNTREKAKKALDIFLKKKSKIELKQGKVTEDLSLQQSLMEHNSENSQIYELEDIIQKYLNKLKIEELNTKFKLMKRSYNNQISNDSKKDIQERKKVIFDNSPFKLDTMYTSKISFKNYKNELKDFIEKLEENKYIVDIIDIINKSLDSCINEEDNELLKDINSLYQLYSKLDETLKQKNIKNLKELLENEKKYFKNYLFRKDVNEECKYDSIKSWEIDFRKKFQVLIEQYRSDFELEQINGKIKNIELARQTLDDNRYGIALLYSNEINKIVDEIKIRTDDSQIIDGLKQFEKIEIDYNKTPEENINIIKQVLMDALKYKYKVDFVLEPEELDEYEENRNTK